MIPNYLFDRPKAFEGKLVIEGINSQTELSILGNIRLPKSFDTTLIIKRLWIFGVNDKQLQNILTRFHPLELIIEECRVKGLTILENLTQTSVIILRFNTKSTYKSIIKKLANASFFIITFFMNLKNSCTFAPSMQKHCVH